MGAKKGTPPADEAPIDYQAFFHGTDDRMIVFRADDPDYTFVDVTEGHSRMTGVKREDLIGKRFFDVFPDVSEKFKRTGESDLVKAFRRLIRTKKPFYTDVMRYDIPDGKGGFLERYWKPTHYPILDGTGNVAYILQTSIDVTKEILAKRDSDDLNRRMQSALDIGGVGSWVWNVGEDELVADAGFIRLFSLPENLTGKPLPVKSFTDAIHPEDRDKVMANVAHAIKNASIFEEEYRTRAKDGTIRWILARGQVTKTDGTTMFPGVMVDVTERHNLQSQVELAKQQDQLNRQQSKILQQRNMQLEEVARTKDEFVALASHQLRTPATAVKQYLGMVMQGYAGEITELQAEMLDKAFESNERQIQIINQILNAARADTGRLVMTKQPVDLRNLCRGIAEDIKAAIQMRHHTFKVSLPKSQLQVHADGGYLRMAIENLLHNASVYTLEGGTIELKLSRDGPTHVCISVSDTGVGIKKADQSKLFEKFSRIHNPLSVQAGGSGIGLYLTAEIVRLHNGKVTVDSKVNHGTTFAIILPLLHNEPQAKGSK